MFHESFKKVSVSDLLGIRQYWLKMHFRKSCKCARKLQVFWTSVSPVLQIKIKKKIAPKLRTIIWTKISKNQEELRHSISEVGWTLQNVTLNNHSKFSKATKLNYSWYIALVNSSRFDFDKNLAFVSTKLSTLPACPSSVQDGYFKAQIVV